MHDFFLSECDMYFQRRCRLNFFLPYGLMLTKTKIKCEILKKSGDMVDRYLSSKFGVNSFSGIRENDVYGRQTTDRQRTDDDGRRALT